ncbi:ChaN family lipoprotein [Desulfonatronum thioautotrophicum]|uniref:ChaN family lipoprotein n=1 Tax=Desulfonatronum thioautotrophicum TaxID=617001 RepID=UPI00069C6302|nr:ChaN family lipoprotein [Desulfonatronum thioautotrophicum]
MGLIPRWAQTILLALVLISTGCARLFPPPLPDPIMPPQPGTLFQADGRILDAAEFAKRSAGQDFILVGESHANACDHHFQAWVVDTLADTGLPILLGLEMVPWSAQSTLDAFHHGDVALDELQYELGWETYWGFDFSLYRPIFEVAEQWNIPVFGLNVPRDLLKRIRADGLQSIPEDERGALPIAIILPPDQQMETIEEEFHRHVDRMPDFTLEAGFDVDRFVMIQSLWDTQMAHVALQHMNRKQQPMVILAGSGHVEYGHGVASRLRQLGHEPSILSVMPWRGGPAPNPAAADLFFYCPEPRRLGLVITWADDQVQVTAVVPGSRAEAAGLLPGDLLVAADGVPITSLEILHQKGMQATKEQRPLRLDVLRDGDTLTIPVNSP